MVSSKAKYIVVGSITLAALVAAVFIGLQKDQDQPEHPGKYAVDIITVPPGGFSYRVSGDFNKANRPVDAPMQQVRFDAPIIIMRNLVSEKDYQLCVNEGGCKPLAPPVTVRDNFPVVGTSWEDANAYANWLSQKTGQTWRLPTDEEWAYAAGSKFHDDALGLPEDADFSQRWIARYDQEAALQIEKDQQPKPVGSYGENENGIADMSGNVWEWTDTCYIRHNLNADGSPVNEPFYICGVRIAEGLHRAYVSDFIRDARGGGCAVGIPPSNLGIRLVRSDTPSAMNRLKRLLRRQESR